MLSELEKLNLPFGLKIERDLYLSKDCTLVDAIREVGITPPEYMLKDNKEEKDITDEIFD